MLDVVLLRLVISSTLLLLCMRRYVTVFRSDHILVYGSFTFADKQRLWPSVSSAQKSLYNLGILGLALTQSLQVSHSQSQSEIILVRWILGTYMYSANGSEASHGSPQGHPGVSFLSHTKTRLAIQGKDFAFRQIRLSVQLTCGTKCLTPT